MLVVLVMFLVVVFFMSLLNFNKVLFLKFGLLTLLHDLFSNQVLDMGSDHVLDLTISISLGTFS